MTTHRYLTVFVDSPADLIDFKHDDFEFVSVEQLEDGFNVHLSTEQISWDKQNLLNKMFWDRDNTDEPLEYED